MDALHGRSYIGPTMNLSAPSPLACPVSAHEAHAARPLAMPDTEPSGALRPLRRYRRYSLDVKRSAVSQYLQGQGTLRSIAESLDVDHSLVWRWANEQRRLADGAAGGQWPVPSRYQRHSPEKKMQVVRAYLQGEGTLRAIGSRFEINHTLVRRWALEHQAGRLPLDPRALAGLHQPSPPSSAYSLSQPLS